jgi:hypothetical protein
MNATKIMSFFITQMRRLSFNQMPYIKMGILAMYMPLSMDTFHPSMSTKASGGAIF